MVSSGSSGSSGSEPFLAAMAMALMACSGYCDWAAKIAERSAQVPAEKAAFSWLAPFTMVPSARMRAAPTWKFEYGA